jgi:protease stability complex PrcB-like protein
MERKSLISFICIMLFLIGCVLSEKSHSKQVKISYEIIKTGTQGGHEQNNVMVTWMDNNIEYTKTIRKLNHHIISKTKMISPIDFKLYGVVLIEMGQKPSAGFGLELIKEYVFIEKGRAILQIRWIEPSKDQDTASVLTSPYLLIKLPRGDYNAIDIIDQGNKLRARLIVNL